MAKAHLYSQSRFIWSKLTHTMVKAHSYGLSTFAGFKHIHTAKAHTSLVTPYDSFHPRPIYHELKNEGQMD